MTKYQCNTTQKQNCISDTALAETPLKMFRIPVYKVMLVREKSQVSETKKITSPAEAQSVLGRYLEGQDREVFVIMMLDTKNKVIGINTVSVGTLNSSLVHPREVFKPAILSNAAAIILAHNHPSGETTPSPEDIQITKELTKAGDMLKIAILDHIIVGDGFSSFKADGYM